MAWEDWILPVMTGGGGGDGFSYEPYRGARPPTPTYLREVEKQIYDILSRRAEGRDVGYDPARRAAQESLIRSSLQRREQDQLRDASGRLSGAGLSGNLRAQEAISGRIQRDNSQDYADALSQISIEDLTRANQERDVNTGRLADFNRFNFGQSNKVADFDLDVYNSEQGNRATAAGINQGYQDRGDETSQALTESALKAAGLIFAPQTEGLPIPASQAASTALSSRQTGYGAAPNLNVGSTPYGSNYGVQSIIGNRRRRVGGY